MAVWRWRREFRRDPSVLVADTPEKCREAVAILQGQPVVGVDVETHGMDPSKGHAIGHCWALSAQFAGEEGPAIFVPLWSSEHVGGGRLSVDPAGRVDLLYEFKEWLEDDTPVKVLHNGKFDRHVLANHGVRMRGILGDTLMMDYYASNGEMLHGLKECVRRYFGDKGAEDYRDVFRRFKKLKKPRLNKVTGEIEEYGKQTYVPQLLEVLSERSGVNQLVQYAVKDPVYTVKLYRYLRGKLDSMSWVRRGDIKLNYGVFYDKLARPYEEVLFDLEREGCLVDQEKLASITSRIEADIEQVERDFLHACVNWGIPPSRMEEFNLNSGAQLASLLYDEMGMRCEVLTDGGAKATSTKALEAITRKRDRSRRAARDAEIVDLVLQQRSKATLRKMFVRPLNKFVPMYEGRVHSNFKQNGTATGRLSSSTPNLENIPANKKDEVYELRSLFVAPPGYVVADIDLKQIEVRLMAHYTGDQVLLDLLRNGWDQHLIAMCMLFPQVREWMGASYSNGVVTFGKMKPDSDAVAAGEKHFGKATWAEWRRRGKILNFSVSYGAGPTGLANQFGGGATKEDGQIALSSYFRGFHGLERGIRRIKAQCHKKGYVRTLLKRYCVIRGIHSRDRALQGQAERQAFNYVIQGSAADMLMMGMILIHTDPRLRKDRRVIMVNQVHDELVLYVKKDYLEKATPIIEEYVSHPYRHMDRILGFNLKDLEVDTPADLGYGASWFEAKK